VRIIDALTESALLTLSQRQAASLRGNAEEEELWRYVHMLNNFTLFTGQVYRFEDFFKGETSAQAPQPSTSLEAHSGRFARPARELLLGTLDETHGPAQKQSVLLLIALLDFMAKTGQLDEVEDFFINGTEYAPMVIAHFASREEAEAWLRSTPEPPSPAYILIGDEYHQFWFIREDNARSMHRDYPLEPVLEALTTQGIPPGSPSFASREEAAEWLKSHPANPYAFVTIAGEYHLAVHHKRLRRHSLHPVASTLQAWEERKRVVAQEAASEPGETSE
jgi:hypothetical protein